MAEKMFPIQSERGAPPHPLLIPWSIAELAYSVYSACYGRGQSLERLAERGGFGPGEMDLFVPDWRKQCSDIARLQSDLTAARERAERWKAEAMIARGELSREYMMHHCSNEYDDARAINDKSEPSPPSPTGQ